LYKNKDWYIDVENYRPISLLSTSYTFHDKKIKYQYWWSSKLTQYLVFYTHSESTLLTSAITQLVTKWWYLGTFYKIICRPM